MKILVIGSGGRESAIVWKLAHSRHNPEIFVLPGNDWMSAYSTKVPLKQDEYDAIAEYVKENNIDITFVGPEQPLVDGIVDIFNEKGLSIIGPNKAAAELEGSKIIAKNFMQKYNIPTAEAVSFDSYESAVDFILVHNPPFVVKADGLAAGKGVRICETKEDAIQGIDDFINKGLFGNAGKRIVVEKFLVGEEVSVFAFCDGKNFVTTIPSQDHKKAQDGDKGLNTGGMGAYAPVEYIPKDIIDTINQDIVERTFASLKKEGIEYNGVLYFGVILTEDGPKMLEYNCRLGDPETQVILPLMENDLVDIMTAIKEQKLDEVKLRWKDMSAVTVVMSSGGYPLTYEKGFTITGLDDVEDENAVVFHAGTKLDKQHYKTNGGRVLNVTALDNSLEQAIDKAYSNVKKIDFKEKYFRTDIGKKGLNK